MENSIRVVIADDNKYNCSRLERHLSAYANIDVVGMASDGLAAQTMMRQLLPDLLVLDLAMPRLDGIGVLEEMDALRLEKVPRIIVMSEMSGSMWEEKALALGADSLIEKPVPGELLALRIQRLMADPSPEEHLRRVHPGSEKDALIVQMLGQIGLATNTKGYAYLREAIGMVTYNYDLLTQVTKTLYPAIAKAFDSTPSRVERAIRHAIETAWNRGSIEDIDRLFGYTIRIEAGKPTNAECIAMLSEYVRRVAST